MGRLTEYVDSQGFYGLKCELGLMRHTNFNIDKAIDKLAEYEDLEEQGMLLKLNAPIEEMIRCAMCTNFMRSDRGCDGNCQVDEIMFNRIMKEILE